MGELIGYTVVGHTSLLTALSTFSDDICSEAAGLVEIKLHVESSRSVGTKDCL